jgi:hypothetical protein
MLLAEPRARPDEGPEARRLAAGSDRRGHAGRGHLALAHAVGDCPDRGVRPGARHGRGADIIIPQAIPPVVPALGNYLVALFKETPLLSAIAVLELMQTAKILGSQTFRYTEPITLVGCSSWS